MDWQRRIDRPNRPSQPMFVSRMGRTFWVPPRYRAIAVATLSGERFSLRALADRLGYSLTGLRHALARMSAWGMFRIVSKRGRLGWTRLLWSDDVSANVPPTTPSRKSRKPKSETVDEDGTFPNVTQHEPPVTWQAVGEMLRGGGILAS